MKRRTFCKTTLGAGIAAALPTASTLAALNALAPPGGDIVAVTTSGDEISIEKSAAKELRESLTGPLLFPNDDGYESARRVWNGMIDKRPAMIAICTTDADVAHAVSFSAERNLLLSVKGGGHSYPGKGVCEGGLMIDLSAMHSVIVNTQTRTARAQGGALLGHLDSAALAQNLVTTAGVVSHTGVGGFTLGGGMGRTDRVHGLAVDNVLEATLITPDGQIRRVSADENEDLFWAIRGGGGNFGVATGFTYRLHPFNPTIYGGSLFYPWSQARQVLTFWAEVNDSLPDAASVEPQGYINAEGERVFELQLYFAGSHEEGEKVFTQFQHVGKPISVDLGLKSYQAVQTMWDGLAAHGQLNYLKSGLLPALTPGAIDAIVESYAGDYLPGVWFQHLGGASSRIQPEATAYSHRQAHSNYGIAATWNDPAESDARIAKIREIYAAVQPHMQGFYTNLHEDTERKTWNNYGVNYERLVKIKNEYDPSNLFRLNANIKPTVNV